jgi:hypothetical protein
MFFLPVVIWRSVYSSTGMKIRAICETCNIKSNMETEARGKNMEVNKNKKIIGQKIYRFFWSMPIV